MTKQDIEDKFFHDFLVWCTAAPEGKDSDLIFWLENHYPTSENFWEWLVKHKAEELHHG